MGGASTLDGRRFVNRRINQPKIGCYGGGALLMRRDRGGTRGENYFLSFWAANGATKEREREGPSVGLKRPPLATTLNTNQPKTVRAMRMVFGMRFDRGGTFGEDNSHCFGRRFDLCKMKQYTP